MQLDATKLNWLIQQAEKVHNKYRFAEDLLEAARYMAQIYQDTDQLQRQHGAAKATLDALTAEKSEMENHVNTTRIESANQITILQAELSAWKERASQEITQADTDAEERIAAAKTKTEQELTTLNTRLDRLRGEVHEAETAHTTRLAQMTAEEANLSERIKKLKRTMSDLLVKFKA